MATTEKIAFPYTHLVRRENSSQAKDMVIFFGCDYYNLPLDSNRTLFVERTQQILDYIRLHFPDRHLVYQCHPNETDEYTFLNLSGFVIEKSTVSESYLYENAARIVCVFSAQSGASISAYAMGFDSFIFLDLLEGALSSESMSGYRSYFSGLPGECFIKSFDDDPQYRDTRMLEAQDKITMEHILSVCGGGYSTVWILSSEVIGAVQGAVLVREMKKKYPLLRSVLLKKKSRRWGLIPSTSALLSSFSESYEIPSPGYSARPIHLLKAAYSAWVIRALPVSSGDLIISFAHPYFSENCILSYNPKNRRVLFLENRWYHFVYSGGAAALPDADFRTPWGSWIFRYILEPILGLHPTIFRQYADGKMMNIHRYVDPIEDIYSAAFIITPH